MVDFAHPVSGFFGINDDGVSLIVGTEDELAEELHFLPIFTLRLHFVCPGSAEVFDSFCIFLSVKQDFIHCNDEFACPVCVERTAEILIGVESGIVLKYGLQKVQKGGLSGVALL